ALIRGRRDRARAGRLVLHYLVVDGHARPDLAVLRGVALTEHVRLDGGAGGGRLVVRGDLDVDEIRLSVAVVRVREHGVAVPVHVELARRKGGVLERAGPVAPVAGVGVGPAGEGARVRGEVRGAGLAVHVEAFVRDRAPGVGARAGEAEPVVIRA